MCPGKGINELTNQIIAYKIFQNWEPNKISAQRFKAGYQYSSTYPPRQQGWTRVNQELKLDLFCCKYS
jgi:hypothetical protein